MHDIRHNIYLHPFLALPDDQNDDIWAYYPIMPVSPIMMEGFMIVILSIPLIDKSLQMDLYTVYSLLALHPELKVQFFYVLQEEYLPSQHLTYMLLCPLLMKFVYALHH